MSRIQQAFARARAENRAAIVAYVCAGDPDFETSIEVCRALLANGVDGIAISPVDPANQTAMLRPHTTGFFAFTPTDRVCRQLGLTRGVQPFTLNFAATIDETIQRATDRLRELELVSPGTPLVIVSDILSDHFAANYILLHHA